MKPGDLARINSDLYGTDGRLLKEGTFVVVVGPSPDPVYHARGCLQVYVDGILEDISWHWLGTVDDNMWSVAWSRAVCKSHDTW